MLVYDHGSRWENKIALTFDDGPNPFFTVKTLDLLDEYSVKASFFVLGQNAEKFPDIVKEIYKRGHLIGNHSYSHAKEGAFDFGKAEDVIFGIIGKHTGFARAPYLDVNRGADYYMVGGNDAVKFINADVFPHIHLRKAEISNFVFKNSQNGSIILLHDGSRKEEEQRTRPAEMFAALP
ncbi:MAG: polysaccharide deacetylase family protein [Candidatus Nealsonbacteria bacterium DGGOD1a]|nr:MAG: polysaccharide deacetylase family protein [Candidatus Nealsonbacteria bacterium DGGOD1a]